MSSLILDFFNTFSRGLFMIKCGKLFQKSKTTFNCSEMEFKEFKPRFKSAKIRQNPVLMKRRLKSWNIWYNLKWNQPYLNRGLNLNRRSNSLNSATGCSWGSHYYPVLLKIKPLIKKIQNLEEKNILKICSSF